MSADIVAILRGVTPERVVAVASVLYETGIRTVEVPLNSPNPFVSIAALARSDLPGCEIGAGTVLTAEDAQRAHEAGARLIVAPNCDADVIAEALTRSMRVLPGFATASEAFTAIGAGARDLKLFPAVTYGPAHLKALKAVLPAGVRVYPVGGIAAHDIKVWVEAGADGFGFGSELYRPEYGLDDIENRARALMRALEGV
jgi:2-dehydro-3-deoxyphosphogalactonate aldolase